jgi:hypothetical protein
MTGLLDFDEFGSREQPSYRVSILASQILGSTATEEKCRPVKPRPGGYRSGDLVEMCLDRGEIHSPCETFISIPLQIREKETPRSSICHPHRKVLVHLLA